MSAFTPYKCEGCGAIHEYQNCESVDDIGQRIAVGDPYTDAQCPRPECGALCYPVAVGAYAESRNKLLAAAPEMLEALRYIAGLDTSQDASPAQCSAVFVAMEAIDKATK